MKPVFHILRAGLAFWIFAANLPLRRIVIGRDVFELIATDEYRTAPKLPRTSPATLLPLTPSRTFRRVWAMPLDVPHAFSVQSIIGCS
jgi:hypothetical protein